MSCKGAKGDKGDAGAQTFPPSQQQPTIRQFTGTVGSGTAFIAPPLATNAAVLVYLESTSLAGSFVLLSFDPTTGPWAEVSYPVAAVTFHNCTSTARYKLLVVDPA